mmetsp:Transcript_11742/g.11377  ORF Transcript_11742/g.11377 Transcript_11742/m.11377 type:complete len:220 (+) Transcript_11742:103-762(+)
MLSFFILISLLLQKENVALNRPLLISSTSLIHKKSFGCTENCWHKIETVIDDLEIFDSSISFQRNEVASSMNLILNTILPPSLLQIGNLKDDVVDMINTTRDLALPNESITCRLALLKGVRCPKWHEDYVKIRLIKTYYGVGTEFVNPDDWIVRSINHLRAYMDLDLEVESSKVIRASVNDVLIVSGRGREDLSIVPVLHRSPPVEEKERRLLLTVTIS